MQAASITTGPDPAAGSSASITRPAASADAIAGPSTRQPQSPTFDASGAASAISPPVSAGRASTPASGTAMPVGIASGSGSATCTLPAPARNAAVAVRISPPGTRVEPPTSITRPRLFLSVPSGWSGSGWHRSHAGSSGRASGPPLNPVRP